MNFEEFLAQRFIKGTNEHSLSKPFVRITVTSVVLSVTVMIISLAIITGFKREIKSKVVGFGSHIQITNYDSNLSYETTPIPSDLACMDDIRKVPGVTHIQRFGLKAGIIKTNSEIQGVVLKGITTDFSWNFFKKNLIAGNLLHLNDSVTTNETLISKTLANMLNLKVGDKYDMFFVQQPPRFRRFTVAGIYDTQMTEFDKIYILCDLHHIQKLNGWSKNQISGYELLVNNISKVDDIALSVDDIAAFVLFNDGSRLKVQSIIDKYPNIFDWVELQDLNAIVLIVLMLLVAGINMISGLLIIILEKTNTIGLLKALGAPNISIRKIFLMQSAYILLKGMIIGTVLGIAICFVQQHFGIIKLNEDFYFLSQVPIELVWWHILLVNVGAFVVGLAMLVVPSMVISRISPEKTLKYE